MQEMVKATVQSVWLNDEEYFYELMLKEKASWIKVFNSDGVMRLSRRLDLPFGEVLTSQQFILIHHKGKLHLQDVIHFTSVPAHTSTDIIPNHFIYNYSNNLFYILDAEDTVCQLSKQYDELKIRPIFRCREKGRVTPITKMLADEEGTLYLHDAEKKEVLKLYLSREEEEMGEDIKVEVIENVIDVFVGWNWVGYVHDGEQHQKLTINDETFVSSINYQPQFSFIKINPNNFIYLNIVQNQLILIHNNELFSNTFQSAFLQQLPARHHKDVMYSVQELNNNYLEIRFHIWDGDKFIKHALKMKKSEEEPIYEFVGRNVELMMGVNGLINPHFDEKARELVDEMGGMEEMGEIGNYEELSCLFLEQLFKTKPQNIIIIANSITRQRQSYYLPTECQRFVQYYKNINKKLSRRLLEWDKRGEGKEGWMKDMLCSMISFMGIVSRAIREEIEDEGQVEGKYGGYQECLDQCRGLYLVWSLLDTDNFHPMVEEWKRHLQTMRECADAYFSAEPTLKANQLYPHSPLHYFSPLSTLTADNIHESLVEVLLQMRSNYIYVAYVYVALMGANCNIPFVNDESVKFSLIFIDSTKYHPMGGQYIEGMQSTEYVRNRLPLVTAQVLRMGDIGLLRYLAQMSIIYQENRSALAILLSKQIHLSTSPRTLLTYYVLSNRVLLGYEAAEQCIKLHSTYTPQQIMSMFGEICQKNMRMKDLFRLPRNENYRIIMQQIKKVWGEQINQIEELSEYM